MIKLSHEPTKRCPHKWCRTLHQAMIIAALPAFLILITRSIANLAQMAVIGVATIWIAYRINGRKSDATLEAEDRADINSRRAFGIPLNVRPVWVRIAIAMDIMYTSLILMASLTLSTGMMTRTPHSGELTHHTDGTAATPTQIIATTLAGLAVFAFREIAHHLASKPRKPKRSHAWAANAANGVAQ